MSDYSDEDRRLREMGIDPDGDPIQIMREVDRIYKALRAKYDENGNPIPDAIPDKPIIVDERPKPCNGADTASAFE